MDTATVTEIIAGQPGKLKTLRKTAKTETEANAAADAEWRRINRTGAAFDVTLALGMAELAPETPITANGWPALISDKTWIVTEVTHTVGSNGFTSALGMELKT